MKTNNCKIKFVTEYGEEILLGSIVFLELHNASQMEKKAIDADFLLKISVGITEDQAIELFSNER